MTPLEKRVVQISYERGLSHVGSCLTALPIMEKIYGDHVLPHGDLFVLSAGHSGVALYVVLERFFGLDANALFAKHGTHPNRCPEDRIECSSGSLGHGLPIAVGMALAEPERTVHCLLSDGECAEGSVWEALRTIRDNASVFPLHARKMENIHVWVNANGWGAYNPIDRDGLECDMRSLFGRYKEQQERLHFVRTQVPPWAPRSLAGLAGHYHKITEAEYEEMVA
jgi:transketolase